MRRPSRLACGLALVALAACSSHDTPASPDGTGRTLVVAALAAEMTLPSLTGLPGASGATPVRPVPAGCSYVAASQRFVCPTVTSGGLTIATSYALLDSAGRPLSTADAGAVAALLLSTTTTGTTTGLATGGIGGTLTVDDRQELVLSGLLGATHTLDGTATSTITAALSMTITTKGVVLPSASGASRWPLAGTVTTETTDRSTAAGGLVIRQTTTFNGTSTVSVIVTIGPITHRCTIDLANPAVLPACS